VAKECLPISIKEKKYYGFLNLLETKSPTLNKTFDYPFLTNLVDEILFKGVDFITPQSHWFGSRTNLPEFRI
jgi:hypothetical protein